LEGTGISDVMVGSVEGYVLNQFSMDQSSQVDSATQTEKDYLRIATCTSQQWRFSSTEDSWQPFEESQCQVSVLEIKATMPIVGSLDDIGKPGERIYSVRFVGDRGFAVTFKDTDPFYTIDLSDPTNPQTKGELEIPGFSSYLHPVGENLLLGVGQSVTEDGCTQGLQISLFDVTDFADPVRRFNYVEADGSYSEVKYDHRGFRYLPESRILILPVFKYSQDNGLDGFQLYVVDEDIGIESYLTVEHGTGNLNDRGCWSSQGYLSPRSIVKDDGLRTFKGHIIMAYNVSNRTAVGSPINLDTSIAPEDCAPYYALDCH
jgi:uncharacterized secreted protein with C-terminal beta-propeller domain